MCFQFGRAENGTEVFICCDLFLLRGVRRHEHILTHPQEKQSQQNPKNASSNLLSVPLQCQEQFRIFRHACRTERRSCIDRAHIQDGAASQRGFAWHISKRMKAKFACHRIAHACSRMHTYQQLTSMNKLRFECHKALSCPAPKATSCPQQSVHVSRTPSDLKHVTKHSIDTTLQHTHARTKCVNRAG